MVDVTPIFAAQLARNRGPTADDPTAREPPNYVVSARLNGAVIDLTLTFRAGAAYCCCEWGCHLGLFQGERWGWLRRELASGALPVPDRLELRLAVSVEPGALFFDYARPVPGRRGLYELKPAEALRYQEVVTEADGPEADTAVDLRQVL